MPTKAVLIEIDEDLWKLAKTRAAALGQTASAFAGVALASHVSATESQAKVTLARAVDQTANYVTSVTPTALMSSNKKGKR